MDKSKLYFVEEDHKYYYDGILIPSVTQVLKHSGYIDYSFVSEKYMNRGTAVHAITELVDQGINDYSLIAPEIVPFVSAYELFIAEMKPVYTDTESIVLGQIDSMLYAGTVDRVILENGAKRILDIKTGFFAKWHPMQIVAYMIAEGLNDGLDLYLLNSGEYKIRPITEVDKYKKLFTSALYKFWYDHKREWNKISKEIVSV